MLWREIPQFPQSHYWVNVTWRFLELTIADAVEKKGGGGACLDLNPEFQRGHVWTEAQQVAYLEYRLQGGSSGRDLYFNCPGWMSDFRGPYVLVDGLQRLTCVRRFTRNELPAFGQLCRDFGSTMPLAGLDFIWHVASLDRWSDVLRWYIVFNAGGTPHSPDEIARVQDLLNQALAEGK